VVIQSGQWLQVYSVHLLHDCNLEKEVALATGATLLRRASERVHRKMVGREPILQVIRGMAKHLVQDNKSSLLMLSGHAGYGKTKMMQHLAADEEFLGFRSEIHIFRAAGTPELRPIPLTPWRSIIMV
jgi:hypothetical protein